MAGNVTENRKLKWLHKQVADSGRECDREQEVKVVLQEGGSVIVAGNVTENGKFRWLYKQVARSGRECNRVATNTKRHWKNFNLLSERSSGFQTRN